jgi:16S rRNA (cytosine967-C5)-methyltransferase
VGRARAPAVGAASDGGALHPIAARRPDAVVSAPARRAVHDDAPGLAARRAAVALVGAVLDAGRSLDAAKGDAAITALAPSERARAGDLAAATLRWLAPTDALLGGLMTRPPTAAAQVARDALRVATVEVGVLDAPPHAAVDAAVRLAKGDARSAPLAGMVNAVARKAAEAAPAALSTPQARLAATPAWLRRRLKKAWGARRAERICDAQLFDAPLDLTLRDPAAAARWADALGAEVTPAGGLRLYDSRQISAAPGYAEGAWWVQDAAAALPARLLGDVAGLRILDICAAPGGKTLQLAAAGAHVTALDASAARLERLSENLDRTGLGADIVCADALDWRPSVAFDAVLLDAPCSATGTLRRHPDIAHLRRDGDIAQSAALQDRLLDAAWALVAPGGRLVFCTCSALPEEGEARARAFLSRTPDARPVPADPSAVGDPALLDAQGRLRTLPHQWDGGLDGFFAARFDRAP